MKKLISIVLSVCMCVSMMVCVSAVAAPVIDVELSTFSVSVTVTADENLGKLTAQIADKADKTATLLVGMAETKVCTETEDGKFQYDLTFTMQPTHPSGTYFVRVGAKGGVYTKEFSFINAQEKVDFFNQLNTATADNNGIYNLLVGENSKITYDLTAYKALSAPVRMLVDKELEQLDVACTFETIVTAETALSAFFDDALLRARLADAKTESGWKAAIEAAGEKDILDDKFWAKTDAKTVMEYFKAEQGTDISIAPNALAEVFDRAQFLAMVKELDYHSVRTGFEYYLEQDVITIDEDNYRKIKSYGLEHDFFRSLKEANNTDFDGLEDNADSLMTTKIKQYETGNNQPATGGGGGGAGGGGGSMSSRPTNSGNTNPSAGVVADGDAKPNANKPAQSVTFSDLENAPWAKEAILALAAKGVVTGRGDGKFYPNDTVTREEFVKMIVLAFDVQDASATASFKDVAADRWSYPYIAAASRLGLVLGDENGCFNPTGTITRQDMAVILYRVYKMAGFDGASDMSFSDEWQMAAYARQAIGVLANEGIISGMGDGTFAPLGEVTRAQTSKVIYELLTFIGGDK